MEQKSFIQKLARRYEELCCLIKNIKTIYTANGSLLSNRTVETDGKNLLFQETASNIGFGINTSPFGTNRAFTVTHVDNGIGFMISNKVENVSFGDGTTADVLGLITVNLATGEFSGNGTYYDQNGNLGALSYYNSGGGSPVVTEIRHNALGIQMLMSGVTILTINANGIISTPATPVYADNAAALAGGLVPTNWYRTATGEPRIVV